jgi:hypothetical protein
VDRHWKASAKKNADSQQDDHANLADDENASSRQ